MVSDISAKTSIFQRCSFISSLICYVAFEEDRKGLSLSADANQQFTGWRGVSKSLERLWGGKEGNSSAFSLSLCLPCSSPSQSSMEEIPPLTVFCFCFSSITFYGWFMQPVLVLLSVYDLMTYRLFEIDFYSFLQSSECMPGPFTTQRFSVYFVKLNVCVKS